VHRLGDDGVGTEDGDGHANDEGGESDGGEKSREPRSDRRRGLCGTLLRIAMNVTEPSGILTLLKVTCGHAILLILSDRIQLWYA